MDQNAIIIAPRFMEIIFHAQEEAKRLGLINVSEIIILKTICVSEYSYLWEFFKSIHLPSDLLKESMEKQVKRYSKEVRSEKEGVSLEFKMNNDKEEKVFFTNNLFDIFTNAGMYSYDNVMNVMDEVTFMLSMISQKSVSNYVSNFFDKIKVDMLTVQRYFLGLVTESATLDALDEMRDNAQIDEESYSYEDIDYEENDYNDSCEENLNADENGQKKNASLIPKKLSNCLSVMVGEKTEKPIILGRDKETNELIKVLLKSKKKNAVLVGEPGVGKTAIVEHLVWMLANGKAEALKNKTFLSLDVNGIISGTIFRGQAEEKFQTLCKFLSNQKDVILFIDEIHTVIGAGETSSQGSLDLANSLKPILARESVSVIGCTTSDEYDLVFAKDGAFKRRFEKIEVKEPKYADVYPMVKNQIEHLSEFHNVKIDKKMIDYIIMIASCFNSNTANPDRTLDLIDRAMATAVMEEKNKIDKNIVLSNFDANFKAFKQMEKTAKMSVAYHETGHYLVRKFNPYLKGYKCLAISVIPTENYEGITVSETNESFANNLWDYNACLAEIAVFLAGRVAEKIYTGQSSAGASSDLKEATKLAREMVMDYGLSSSFSVGRHFDNKDMSEKSKEILNIEVEKIISEAYKLASTILNTHKDMLKMISDKLCQNGIIIGEELDKMCQKEISESTTVIINN